MRISTVQHGSVVEVIAEGRLDEAWADHLSSALDGVVREGTHHVRLNMGSVTYLSSAGIRVLVRCYNDLKEINGSFAVTQPSKQVRTILDMTHLSPLLMMDAPPPEARVAAAEQVSAVQSENASFELLDAHAGNTLACRVVGDHGALERRGAQTMSQVRYPGGTFGFGVGAFGSGFGECRERFGEFLAAGRAAAYLPTDGASVPDYLTSAGTSIRRSVSYTESAARARSRITYVLPQPTRRATSGCPRSFRRVSRPPGFELLAS